MARLIEKRRISCHIKHIEALIVRYDDGSFVVKCVDTKTCGETCPYMKDPDFRRVFKRAPEYKPEL